MSYYYNQHGAGNALSGGIGRIYVGAPYQRGSGIGSFLGGVFRFVLPMLKRGAKAVGKEFLQTGMNIASDVGELRKPFKEAFKTRVRQSTENLQQKARDNLEKFMSGEGYKVHSSSLPSHLARALAVEKKRKRKSKKKKRRRADKRIKRKISGKKVAKKTRKKIGRKRKTKTDFVDIFR